MHNAQYVYFNDGENEDLYALVVNARDGNVIDIWTPNDGSFHASVPHREKADYAAGGGGGDTWHL
jgi:hypothetical protein